MTSHLVMSSGKVGVCCLLRSVWVESCRIGRRSKTSCRVHVIINKYSSSEKRDIIFRICVCFFLYFFLFPAALMLNVPHHSTLADEVFYCSRRAMRLMVPAQVK